MATKLDHEVADLKRRLDDALAERDEAEAQKTAMAEVLEVINSSHGDLKPVFDAMLERAMRLCDAAFGGLGIWHDDCFEWIADRGLPLPFAEYIANNEVSVGSRSGFARVAQDDGHVQFSDISASSFYKAHEPYTRAIVELGGARTTLSVPLVKDGGVIGVFGFFRQEVRPFAEKQIALVKSFAAQAVIAMENARLITETRESLEYQTATSDVLKVISRSTFDLHPVLQTVVETATRLCGADMGFLLRREGDEYRTGAAVGYTREYEQFMQTHPLAADRGSITGRVALQGKTVHIVDVTADPEYTLSESATLAGQRTALGVPLLREGQPVGVIVLARRRVEPFTEKQIELVTTFADQAVIAIENTRLITDTHEALEQQTATAEVLGVINSSPGDLVPVFNAMLEKATRLCAASFGILLTYDGQRFRHAALRGIPPAYAEFMRQHPPIYGPDSAPGRLLAGENLIHVLDMTDTDLYRSGEPNRIAIADLAGARTVVAVPLRKDDVLMGAIVVFRQEIRALSEKQLSLLRNFAAQAVIAMENARLITETHEALEQQTATAEVLQVINSSPGDLTPVFDAILEKAHTLCGASKGSLVIIDGEQFRTAATRGLSEPYAAILREAQHNPPGSVPDRLLKGEDLVHIADASQSDFPVPRAAAELEGARTIVYVPLRKDGTLIGYITAYRQEVRPFTDKQIALLQNFAAQAVIAMENARR